MLMKPLCWVCHTVLSHKLEEYKKNLTKMTEKDALDALHLPRWCCRSMILSHVEISRKVVCYSARPSVPSAGSAPGPAQAAQAPTAMAIT